MSPKGRPVKDSRSEPELGKPTVRDRRGARGNVSQGQMGKPPAAAKPFQAGSGDRNLAF